MIGLIYKFGTDGKGNVILMQSLNGHETALGKVEEMIGDQIKTSIRLENGTTWRFPTRQLVPGM